MTTISIVIPIHNRAAYLPRTLASVVAQTTYPLEIILVDNASTDNSVEVCRSFIADYRNDERFCFKLLSEPAPGAAAARDRGLEAVTGQWVYFFDSDDEMSADFLQDVAQAIGSSPCDVVAATTVMVFEDGRRKRRKVYYTQTIADHILTGMLATQSVVVRTDFLRQLGGWDATIRVWDDWELGIRLLTARPHLVWIKHKAYHRIYQHSESITGSNFYSRHDGLMAAFEAARRDIEACSTPNRRISLIALTLRANLLSGILLRERKAELSRQWQNYLPAPSPLLAIFCRLLRRYTAIGLPGGWWMARTFLRLRFRKHFADC